MLTNLWLLCYINNPENSIREKHENINLYTNAACILCMWNIYSSFFWDKEMFDMAT